MDISTGWPSLISTHGYIHGYPYPRQPWECGLSSDTDQCNGQVLLTAVIGVLSPVHSAGSDTTQL